MNDKIKERDSGKWLKLFIIAVILFIGLSIFYSTYVLGIAAKWFVAFISFSAVGTIFYAFAGVFTKKKLIKWLVTVVLVCFSFFIYWQTHKEPKVVHMQEDVLYIKPKAHR